MIDLDTALDNLNGFHQKPHVCDFVLAGSLDRYTSVIKQNNIDLNLYFSVTHSTVPLPSGTDPMLRPASDE